MVLVLLSLDLTQMDNQGCSKLILAVFILSGLPIVLEEIQSL